MKRAYAIIAGLMIMVVVGVCAAVLYMDSASRTARRPDFTLPDLAGQPRSISEFDGKIVIVNFWATWCAPCRHEIPMLVQAQKDYSARGVRILGIAVDTRNAATAFKHQYDINYPILAAPAEGARVQDAYTTDTTPAGVLPYTVIVDRDGRMVAHIAGALTHARLKRLITPLLARPSAKTGS